MSDLSALINKIGDLERRLKAMERSAQLGHSTITDGDDDAVPVVPAILAGKDASTQVAAAIRQIATEIATADGNVTIYYEDPADPSELEVGDLLIQGQAAFSWDGSQWVSQSLTDAMLDSLIAAQNAQDTADGKIETYWQPTPPPTGNSGDLWFDESRGNKPHVWDGGWSALPMGQGALDLGVVANTIRDPSFKDGSRTPPATYWTINGPDAGTGENFITCAAPGEIARWSVGKDIPCEEGRAVRYVCKIRKFGPANGAARLSLNITLTDGSVTYRIFDVATEDLSTDWQTFENTSVVPAGTEKIELILATLDQTAGTISFMHPELQVLWSQVQSADFTPGESGWALDAETTQVNNLSVLNDVGATSVSADTILLDGEDLATDIIEPLPKGGVAFGSSASGSHAGNIAGVERGLFRMTPGAIAAGHIYRNHLRFTFACADQPAAWDFWIYYTTDGTEPSTGSPILDGSLTRVNTLTYMTQDVQIHNYFAFGSTIDTLRFKLVGQRVAGTTYGWIIQNEADRRLQWMVEDLSARSTMTQAIAQILKGGGLVEDPAPPPPDPPDPPSTYKKSWYATWARSYDQNNGTRDGDDTSDLYQGYVSGTHGNTKSLFGFDDADIRSKLSGATIKNVQLTFKVKHAYWGKGARAVIRSHDYSSKPSSYNESRVFTSFTDGSTVRKSGRTYTVTLDNSVGNNFKSGAVRGLGFGPGGSTSRDWYAYMYGAGSGRPRLTITYSK